MITLLTGENSFEISRELERLIDAFEGRAEKVDGSTLELRQLPDLLMGATLFADRRLIIIKGLAENKTLWDALVDWLPRVSDDVHLVLVDEKPDKRTKTYKELQKVADVREYKAWSERDVAQVEKWVKEEAQRLGVSLDARAVTLLVRRVGINQWLLSQALQKLRVLDPITSEVIEEVIEANPAENVFNLFDAALKGNTTKLVDILGTLKLGEDPYRLFGLVSTQAFQLLALGIGERTAAETAKDLGAHPFALSKLAPYAKQLGASGTKKVFAAFVEADGAMKTSSADPWLCLERALVKVATLK